MRHRLLNLAYSSNLLLLGEKKSLAVVGAVGAQVTDVQEDVSGHPFLSLPSHPRAALAHVAGFSSGQSLLLQAAVPALL